MMLAGKDGAPIEESEEAQQAFFADPTFIHFVGMISPPRPGVADTIHLLEFTYYHPSTPRNNLLSVRVIEWMDITWAIVSIPINERSLMERAALPNRVRIANGIPHLITDKRIVSFPIGGPNVFTLENIQDHPVYQK